MIQEHLVVLNLAENTEQVDDVSRQFLQAACMKTLVDHIDLLVTRHRGIGAQRFSAENGEKRKGTGTKNLSKIAFGQAVLVFFFGKDEKAIARKGQTVGLVIAGTMLIWLAANWAGPALGLPGRYALLFDFAALAALIWAMVVIYQIWQARRAPKDT